MNPEELILGFDARVGLGEPSLAWTQERMKTFLLRLDIIQPLSTDRLVWPSVLGLDSQSKSGSWNGLDLWENLQALQEYVKDGEVSVPYWIISITLLTAALSEEEQELWAPRLPLAPPSMQSEAWSFLGYDISDLSLLSALQNCGYTRQQELQQARKRWGSHLNSFHLFDEPREAIEFKEFSNLRVPEHAPFFVYGLYRLQNHLE